MDASSIVIILSVLSTVAVAYPLPKAALFPIVECPDDDTPFPQVVLLPSVGGVELTANQYVVCFQGTPHVFNCSEGLFFNWAKLSCDFPYERSSRQSTNDTSDLNGILDLIPVGPIPIPISPQYPIPFWPDRKLGVSYPLPPFPITRPNPEVLPPIPVQTYPRGRPPTWIPRPSKIGEIYPGYPITKPNPAVLPPLPVLPAHPPPLIPRPVPYLP
ncbi:unnamed protein product [Orchesella dallaii]|uniref:Chitin-binding type-2 domain-containing protein n=1 Tax=Orchesella dallaii TaxID=48710 RepID=A0ABP1RNG8_9HEXA